jgi:hypothetical protein
VGAFLSLLLYHGINTMDFVVVGIVLQRRYNPFTGEIQYHLKYRGLVLIRYYLSFISKCLQATIVLVFCLDFFLNRCAVVKT